MLSEFCYAPIFINDFPSILDTNINILLLVDNTKLYFNIKSISDANILYFGLNTFFQWSEQNLLPLKSKILLKTWMSISKIIYNLKLCYDYKQIMFY
ncbi:putative RNA-directed DNA polymerase, partial [Aphis craccivora]